MSEHIFELKIHLSDPQIGKFLHVLGRGNCLYGAFRSQISLVLDRRAVLTPMDAGGLSFWQDRRGAGTRARAGSHGYWGVFA
jgi:hypothetical protein